MTKHTPSVPALKFHDTKFRITKHTGAPWLRGAQIALALGYRNPENAAKDLYNRHAAEFTDSMTALVKLKTKGGEQEVRIFSLRGAHLLGMFARTERAAEFRRWVLDILDAQNEADAQRRAKPGANLPALPPPRRIRSRDDLSMTARDSEGRMLNWMVPSRTNSWHEHVGIGEEWFAEVVELAKHNPHEAFDALRFAGEGLVRTWNYGHECGFMTAFARWAVAAMIAHKGEAPALPFKLPELGIPPREGFEHYRKQAAPKALPAPTMSKEEREAINKRAWAETSECARECFARRRAEMLNAAH